MTDIGNDAWPYPIAPWLSHAYSEDLHTYCWDFGTAPEDLTVESVTFNAHGFDSATTLYAALYAANNGALVYEDTTGYSPASTVTDGDVTYTFPTGWDRNSGDGIVIACRTSGGTGASCHKGGTIPTPFGIQTPSYKDWHFGPGFPDPGSYVNGASLEDAWAYMTYTTGGGTTGLPFQRKRLGNFLEL